MINTTQIPLISTFDITREELPDLAELTTNRQKDINFMKFLKEKPMTNMENLAIFQKELDSPNCLFKGIKLEGQKDIVGFLLFHCFNQEQSEIELGFRINPSLQHKGVCTTAVQQILLSVLSNEDITSIIGWHSARNKGSFGVFKKAGFSINTFVPNQTFLPNIGQITDDFNWKLSKILSTQLPSDIEHIKSGLQKHNLNLDF